MLKLHTSTQQTLALIVTASATGVCDRALKNAQDLKNVTVFCCLSVFAIASLTK
jgi:hypothetical protein